MSNSSLSENTSINNDTDTPPNPLTPPPSPVSPNEKPIARLEATESSTSDEINAETELETETETEANNEIEAKTDIQTDIQTDTQINENVIFSKNCLVIQISTLFICYLNIIREQKSKRMMNRMKMPKMMRLFQMVIQYHTFRH